MIYLIAFIITALYAVFLSVLIWHWKQIPSLKSNSQDIERFISVLIPVRNEARNIERIIHSIQKSNVKSSELEVIVVDDHSDDETVRIVKELSGNYSNLFIAHLPDDLEGKKAAITNGVRLANADLIVCTDADCEVHSEWLNCHWDAFQHGARLAFGPVKLFNQKKSRAIDMLNLELAALVAMGGATLGLKRPTMINGCNYSFSKRVFSEVDGFKGNEMVASGDDEFLLRKVFGLYPSSVRFLKTKEALVTSEPPQSLPEFFNQRRRWASKWKVHQDGFSKMTPTFLFLAYMIWVAVAIQSVADGSYLVVLILGAKSVFDFWFISVARKLQGGGVSARSFVLLQIIYPIYVVFFGVASNFGRYSWRERVHKI